MPAVDLLSLSVTDVRPFASLLRALTFRPRACVQVDEGGLKLIVEEGRSVQAHAYVTSDTFASYEFNPPAPRLNLTPPDDGDPPVPGITFEICLKTLLECLNIYGNAMPLGGGNPNDYERRYENPNPNFRRRNDEERGEKADKITAMRMHYAGVGEPLVILLEEGGTVTRCELVTYDPEPMMVIPFDGDVIVQKVIMKAEWLRDAFAEMDSSAEKLTFTFGAGEDRVPTPYNRAASTFDGRQATTTFRLEATGTLGTTEMDYPNDRDVLEVFECDSIVRNTYKFSHIQLTLRALTAATKVSIRTVQEGLISFQFMIPLVKAGRGGVQGKDGFVDFLVVPLC